MFTVSGFLRTIAHQSGQLARDKNVTPVNALDVFAGKKELSIDDCHPNRKGAGLLAETVYVPIISNSQRKTLKEEKS